MATVAILPMPGGSGVLRSVAVPPATGEVDPLVLTRARHGDEAARVDFVRHSFRSLPQCKGASALGRIRSPTRRPAPRIAVERDDLATAVQPFQRDYRAAVMPVDAYGLDYGDAAEVLRVLAGMMGSRLSRARTALRATVGGAAA